MRRTKNFVNRDARPQSATEADFEALFARHAPAMLVARVDEVPLHRLEAQR